MIRIQDNLWLSRSSIDGLLIDDNKAYVFIDEGSWEIYEKYLTDACTSLNVTIGDVLAQLGRNK